MTVEDALKAEPRFREMIEGTEGRRPLPLRGGDRGAQPACRDARLGGGDRQPADHRLLPLYRRPRARSRRSTGWTDRAVGLVKFDFLGLRTLTAIDDTLKLLKELRGSTSTRTPLSSPTRKRTSAGARRYGGVFQAESRVHQLVKNLKPDQFNHLIDMVALHRPGPSRAGWRTISWSGGTGGGNRSSSTPG